MPPEPRIEVERLDPKDVHEISRDPEVAAIAPRMPTRLIEPRDDVETGASADGDAWGIAAVGADVSTFTGAGTVVAVLDTGIDSSHPAFAGVTLVQEDFSGSGNGDVQGHGSHCAGTVFGRDVNGARIGVALGVDRALIGKVLDDDGGGSSEMLFSGIQWAVEGGADVVSMSLGFDFPGLVAALTGDGWPVDLATSRALEAYRGNLRMFDALMNLVRAREAFGGGTIVVAAAGNESQRQQDPDYEIGASLPAAAEGVVSVGALGQEGSALTIAPFSNTFPQVSAPGVAIKSVLVGGGTKDLNGTSMACPHVAGVAALWWEAVRSSPLPATARTVQAKLLASARTDVFAPGVEVADRGVGLVKAP
ncbi:MAG TPA: S8 family serine peptidase [Acidimicrobiales bacterium]|nr:S8 family serine peptidase [Acidimicrobiales bacterium]